MTYTASRALDGARLLCPCCSVDTQHMQAGQSRLARAGLGIGSSRDRRPESRASPAMSADLSVKSSIPPHRMFLSAAPRCCSFDCTSCSSSWSYFTRMRCTSLKRLKAFFTVCTSSRAAATRVLRASSAALVVIKFPMLGLQNMSRLDAMRVQGGRPTGTRAPTVQLRRRRDAGGACRPLSALQRGVGPHCVRPMRVSSVGRATHLRLAAGPAGAPCRLWRGQECLGCGRGGMAGAKELRPRTHEGANAWRQSRRRRWPAADPHSRSSK